MLAGLLLVTGCGQAGSPVVASDNELPAQSVANPSAPDAGGVSTNDSHSGQPSSSQPAASQAWPGFPYTFTDARGRTVTLASPPQTVVAAEGSLAEIWQLAGGKVCGVPNDVQTEGRMTLSADMTLIGSLKEPNAEIVLALQPDLVILAPDIEGHSRLAEILAQNQVPYAFFKVEYFTDYLAMLKVCTGLTGQATAYETNGSAVQTRIQAILDRVAGQPAPDVLLIRAFAKGAKARNADHPAGAMLAELGAANLADRYPSLLDELSLELIIRDNPDYIFITTMGAVDQAIAYLEQGIMANPAWQSLAAVQANRVYVLPKDLFQYKPNARWDEAYDYLAKILYPDA